MIVTFNYTGEAQTFNVPNGVTHVQATVVGGEGGSYNALGGKGGVVTTLLNVSGLTTIDVFVAGVGSGTAQGCGGGGASVLSKTIDSQTTYYVIAGGGGGAAEDGELFVNGGDACIDNSSGGAGSAIDGTAGGGGANGIGGSSGSQAGGGSIGALGYGGVGGAGIGGIGDIPVPGGYGGGIGGIGGYGDGYMSGYSSAGGGGAGYGGGGGGYVGEVLAGVASGGGGGSYANPIFASNPTYASASSVGNGSVTLSWEDPTCFNEGTKILCLNNDFFEEYRLVENLRKGDLVKSYKHGYRKIDLIGKNQMINNPDVWNKCMYKMKKSDLIVTGGHSILVDTIDSPEEEQENNKIFGEPTQIDDKKLLLASVSKDFEKLEDKNLYTYYHFVLENNGNDEERFGVWANGILTETPSKTHFNTHTYTLL